MSVLRWSWWVRVAVFGLTVGLLFVDPRFRVFSIPYYDYMAIVVAVLLGLSPERSFISGVLLVRVTLLLVPILFLGPVGYLVRALTGPVEPTVDILALPRMMAGVLMYATVWTATSRQSSLLRAIVHGWIVAAGILVIFLLDGIRCSARFSGTFADPNYFGSYQAAVATVLLGLLGTRNELMRHPMARTVGILAFLVTGVSVALTLSRGATLSLLVGFGALLGSTVRHALWDGLGLTVAITVLAAAAYSVINMSPLSAFVHRLSIQSALETGGTGRLEIWKEAIDSLAGSPLGLGWGARVHALGHDMATHNFALEMGVQFGLFGIVAAMTLYALFLSDCLRLLRRSDGVANAFGSAGLALLAASLALDVLAWRHFWFVLGTVGALARVRNPQVVEVSDGAQRERLNT